nr:MAG TPA: hypothetical protein [Caudoviricetes sp.]
MTSLVFIGSDNLYPFPKEPQFKLNPLLAASYKDYVLDSLVTYTTCPLLCPNLSHHNLSGLLKCAYLTE